MAYEWARWLEPVLRDAGVVVIPEPGWETRGHDGWWEPRGLMIHHDASPPGETSDGADVIVDGRPGLAGPLAQLWLSYDGAWHLRAAGRAYHAGEGQWGECPRDRGNDFYLGLETDHTTNESWSGAQRSSALTGTAAILDHLGVRSSVDIEAWFTAHKEYAAGRKVDPDPLDMAYARQQLLAFDPGGAPVFTLQTSNDHDVELSAGGWKPLPWEESGTTNLLAGPHPWWCATVEVYATGRPGDLFSLRPYRNHSDDDDDDLYTIRTYEIGSDGYARVDLAQQGSLPDRMQVRVSGTVTRGQPVTLTAIRAQVSAW